MKSKSLEKFFGRLSVLTFFFIFLSRLRESRKESRVKEIDQSIIANFKGVYCH